MVFSAPEWTVRGEGSVHCGWAVQAGQPAEAEKEALGDSLFGLLVHIRLETRSQLASPKVCASTFPPTCVVGRAPTPSLTAVV